jgi:hypothetical protein
LALLAPLRARTRTCQHADERAFIGLLVGARDRGPSTRVRAGVIADDLSPEKPSKPLKTKELEKCRKTRQNSSKLVKTELNSLIHNVSQ